MRFDLLKVVGSSPALLGEPRGREAGARGEPVDRVPDVRMCQHRGAFGRSASQNSESCPLLGINSLIFPAAFPMSRRSEPESALEVREWAPIRSARTGFLESPKNSTTRVPWTHHHLQDLSRFWREAERTASSAARRRPCGRLYPFLAPPRRSRRRPRAFRRQVRSAPGRGRCGGAGRALRYEPSRGGELFPHLYGDCDLARRRSGRLPLGPTDHVFPELAPDWPVRSFSLPFLRRLDPETRTGWRSRA